MPLIANDRRVFRAINSDGFLPQNTDFGTIVNGFPTGSGVYPVITPATGGGIREWLLWVTAAGVDSDNITMELETLGDVKLSDDVVLNNNSAVGTLFTSLGPFGGGTQGSTITSATEYNAIKVTWTHTIDPTADIDLNHVLFWVV